MGPKEVDEEAVMSKRKEEAEANIAKGKAAKAKEGAASFKHDPEEKAKKEEKEEKTEEKEEKEEKKETPKKKEEKVAAPEKVHVLEPEVYQNKANTNTPNLRTTFYDKKSQKDQKDSKM